MDKQVVVRNILEFNKDNERLLFSHTCKRNRLLVSDWIPDKSVFRTLTRPKVLPSLFSIKAGVYYIKIPEDPMDFYFVLSMLGHTDLHQKGIVGLKWFNANTKENVRIDTRRTFIAGFLSEGVLYRDTEKSLVVRERMMDNYDKSIIFQDKKEWRLLKPFVETNSSIVKFVFKREDVSKICYADIFQTIHRRGSVEYIDISGDLSDESIEEFLPLFETLLGVAFRNTPAVTLCLLLNLVSGYASIDFSSIMIEGANLSIGAESHVVNVLNATDVEKLSITRSSFSRNGFVKLLSSVSGSYVRKLSFRRCKLSTADVIACLFMPTIQPNRIKELSLAGVSIPECASSVLYACVSNPSLERLSLEGCNLGKNCLSSLADSLLHSDLHILDVRSNNLGEISHNIFINIGVRLTIRNLHMDNCVICVRSKVDLKSMLKMYHEKKKSIKVEMENITYLDGVLENTRKPV